MSNEMKVTASHLQRIAYLYVRQSSLRQVMENRESTQRQYGLRQRAVALGWPLEQIEIIDTDLGQSGTSSADRLGFQKLVAEVGLGRAGIVMGLEVSRLARNCSDWHRLIEICALSDTLILDEDGLYDPSEFNDRLVLGLKGTLSEAELHLLRGRLRGGMINKARRGELQCHLPIGLTYDPRGQVVLDPDQQVQESIRLLFKAYGHSGTAHGTVKYFRDHGLLFPRRVWGGGNSGKIVWDALGVERVLLTLHNPRYAGVYAFGKDRRRHRRKGQEPPRYVPFSPDQWQVFLRQAHPGYISWEEFEHNQQQIQRHALAYGADRHHGPPREGPALLQGRVICGVCGCRMSVHYHQRRQQLTPGYVCNRQHIQDGSRTCQTLEGASIDAAIGKLLIEKMTPLALEVALAVQQEIQERLEEADRWRYQHVERAKYEADAARRRYLLVDPSNRLVADTLEADWNERLRDLVQAQDQYERQRIQDRMRVDEDQRRQITELTQDFPAIWSHPQTTHRERKRMLELLIEDVTLTRAEQVTAQVRFRGGATTTLLIPLPLNAWQGRQTPPAAVARLDELLNHHTYRQVAQCLNQQGYMTGAGVPFSSASVQWVQESHGLKSYKDRLLEQGMLTPHQIAKRCGIPYNTVKFWRQKGRIHGLPYNDRGNLLYYPRILEKPSKMKSEQEISPLNNSSTSVEMPQKGYEV